MSERSFIPGDVVRYEPSQYHCREGTAIAHERGSKVVLLDTFWGGYGDQHRVTVDELASAELLFNLADYDELDCYSHSSRPQWKKYAPADRQRITSQHGLQSRWFIRKGAAEDWPTKIENARQDVAARQADLAQAQRDLQWAHRELTLVCADADAAEQVVQ